MHQKARTSDPRPKEPSSINRDSSLLLRDLAYPSSTRARRANLLLVVDSVLVPPCQASRTEPALQFPLCLDTRTLGVLHPPRRTTSPARPETIRIYRVSSSELPTIGSDPSADFVRLRQLDLGTTSCGAPCLF